MAVPRNIIIEFTPVGNSVKVSAVCEDSGREVSIVGDRNAGKTELEMLAVRKLKYVMAKDEKTEPTRRGFEA